MTFPIFGEQHAAREAQQELAGQFERRNRVAENSTRQAVNAFTYTTTGVGTLVVQQSIDFDCVFIQEPSFTSGVYIAQPPDTNLYRYPLVTAGVYKWKSAPQKPRPPAEAGGLELEFGSVASALAYQAAQMENEPQFYMGAYLYFVVKVDPIQTPRSDGSNLTALQRALASASSGSTSYAALQANISEAKLALKLKANPAQLRLHHHLQFSGIAMKKLSDGILSLHDDDAAEPSTDTSHLT